MPDESQPPPEPTPHQQWMDRMGKDNAILALSAKIVECTRNLEELDDDFDKTRKHMLEIIADVERNHHQLDKAVEEWKIRKQDLFVQHFTTPLMDRSNKALAGYFNARRYRSVSLRSQDPARIQAQALMERIEKEAASKQPPKANETQETSTPENPAAPSAD